MADTRRTVGALQTLLADNASGAISAQDARDELVSAHPTNVVQSNTDANTPSADQLIGDLYLPSNGLVGKRWNGSIWQLWGPLFPFTAPVDADFSWVNQGTASVVTTFGGIYLVGQAAGSSILRARVKTAPATPYTVTIAFTTVIFNDNEHEAGVCFRESGTGELKTFGFQQDGPFLVIRHMTSPTARGVAHRFFSNHHLSPLAFLRIGDDGANRTYATSPDGQNWSTFYSEGRTTDMTADQVGFYVGGGATLPPAMTLLSWAQA